jgi:hypothetical protein
MKIQNSGDVALQDLTPFCCVQGEEPANAHLTYVSDIFGRLTQLVTHSVGRPYCARLHRLRCEVGTQVVIL